MEAPYADWLESPVSAGFSRFPCGHGKANFPDF